MKNEISNCLFCKKQKVVPMLECSVLDLNKIETAVGRCLECKSLSIISNDIGSLSENDILNQQVKIHNQQWDSDTEDELNEYAADLKTLVDYFIQQFSLSAASKILEVGAGRGGLIRAFLNQNINNIIGCEPSLKLYKRAIEIYGFESDNLLNCTSSEVFSAQKEMFDLIIYWHSLEHIPYGLDELRNASKFIGDVGKIVIQVPLLHDPWVYDEHLFFMSEETLVYLEQNTTLSVEYVDYDYKNMFMTVVFKNKSDTYKPFKQTYKSLFQLYNRAILSLRKNNEVLDKINFDINEANRKLINLLEEKMGSINSYETLMEEKMEEIDSYKRVVSEKLQEIDSYKRVVSEKMETIQYYEHKLKMINK